MVKPPTAIKTDTDLETLMMGNNEDFKFQLLIDFMGFLGTMLYIIAAIIFIHTCIAISLGWFDPADPAVPHPPALAQESTDSMSISCMPHSSGADCSRNGRPGERKLMLYGSASTPDASVNMQGKFADGGHAVSIADNKADFDKRFAEAKAYTDKLLKEAMDYTDKRIKEQNTPIRESNADLKSLPLPLLMTIVFLSMTIGMIIIAIPAFNHILRP